jgi:hypothetical protein
MKEAEELLNAPLGGEVNHETVMRRNDWPPETANSQ